MLVMKNPSTVGNLDKHSLGKCATHYTTKPNEIYSSISLTSQTLYSLNEKIINKKKM